MDKVSASPQALREVRSAIDRGQREIQAAIKSMRSSLQKADWQDSRRRDFERDLEEVLRSLSSFDARANDLKSYLSRKADELTQFLRR